MKSFSWGRVWAIILRHQYNFRHSLDRMVDTFYWPSVDIVMWGLTIFALQRQGNVYPGFINIILTAVVLWYVIWKGQTEITVNILEELWSENMENLWATPLRLSEYVVALCLLGIFRFFMTTALIATLAFVFFGTNVFAIGYLFIPFSLCLMLVSWVVGFLIGGLFLRFGTNIQTLAWSGAVILMPFSATFYPLSSLPTWMQLISKAVPSSYIFEGMRGIVLRNQFSLPDLFISYILAIIYLILAGLFFFRSFQKAKNNGLAHVK